MCQASTYVFLATDLPKAGLPSQACVTSPEINIAAASQTAWLSWPNQRPAPWEGICTSRRLTYHADQKITGRVNYRGEARVKLNREQAPEHVSRFIRQALSDSTECSPHHGSIKP